MVVATEPLLHVPPPTEARASILAKGWAIAGIVAGSLFLPHPRRPRPSLEPPVRGECRAGFGERRLTMFVNGTMLAETTESGDGEYLAFGAIWFGVASPTAETDVRFDNAFAIGIQPS